MTATDKKNAASPRRFDGAELVVATHNKGKLREIRALFGDRIGALHAASDFNLESPAETGTTFAENALIKAHFVAKATGKVALADDSGFCVDALDGRPGVYAADWAEQPDGTRDFYAAMRRVRDEIESRDGGWDAAPKGAHFVSCLALVWPDGHEEVVIGESYGDIVWPPRGDHGFGYDPMFVPEGGRETYGEMDMDKKNDTNHRARSFKKLIDRCFR
jgi:XTP/dITP diphosphohydrolase